jgi:hypothetical protein
MRANSDHFCYAYLNIRAADGEQVLLIAALPQPNEKPSCLGAPV